MSCRLIRLPAATHSADGNGPVRIYLSFCKYDNWGAIRRLFPTITCIEVKHARKSYPGLLSLICCGEAALFRAL